MQILFIGTGGGRVNLIRQLRGTGGFIIKGSASLYVDPGPGALTGSIRFSQDLSKIDVLIITHSHIDHSNDAALILEAMTTYATEKKGILVGSRNTLEGSGQFDSKTAGARSAPTQSRPSGLQPAVFDRALSRYHQSKIGERHILEAGQRLKLAAEHDGKQSEFELEGMKAKHDEFSAFGFKLRMDGKTIGYTSDTEFFPELPAIWKGCDVLIVNNLKPMHDGIPDHLASEDTVKILRGAQPKLAIITHMGMKLIRKSPELEAQKISEESGVRVIAARDGMVFDCDTLKFSIISPEKEKKKESQVASRKLSEFDEE